MKHSRHARCSKVSDVPGKKLYPIRYRKTGFQIFKGPEKASFDGTSDFIGNTSLKSLALIDEEHIE